MAEIHAKSTTLPESRAATLSGPADDYLICRSTDTDEYSFWSFDINRDPLLRRSSKKEAKFDRTHQLIPIGKYLLEWGPLDPPGDQKGKFPYRLLEFDATSKDPLSVKEVISGKWRKSKFWGRKADFGNPNGPSKAYDKGEKLLLVPLGTFVLNVIPTTGRGTYKLFTFDPKRRSKTDRPLDPLYKQKWSLHGSFGTIEYGHDLIPLGNYVLDRKPETKEYWLWSVDPMNEAILARPAIQKGIWDDIDESHKLTPIGEYVLDWDTAGGSYRVWSFDPTKSNPLVGPVKRGSMPDGFDGKTMALTGVQGLRPIDDKRKQIPGTIDFMRTKIEHVVYYMLENRSFDHVCGWLYEKGQQNINFIGPDHAFRGADEEFYNLDPDGERDKEGRLPKVKLNKGGEQPAHDPYHDMTDTIRQCFSPYGENGDNRNGYAEGKEADMGGFVWNNGMEQVMTTFTPETLPVLNGLAKHFAVSDEWFSSMPGATASQRAFSLTGSALLQLNNFMNGPQYTYWPYAPHRASIWKMLWANGFTDWKIYNSVLWPPRAKPWQRFVYSYQLFLKKQIPTVDVEETVENYIQGFDDFLKDARDGTLPRFSFVEPVWIQLGAGGKPATSYHPYGNAGTVPGEVALNEVYKALRQGKNWDKTLLIITFDEHGGFYDHVPPPRAVKPWPNDENDGFRYDLMGVRVPTILVSPWITEQTVFRSTPKEQPYDSTSILATLLHWYGIPKARWCMGDRAHHAPTFEGVFQERPGEDGKPKRKTPSEFELPPEPKDFADAVKEKLDDTYDEMVPPMVEALVGERLSAEETSRIAEEILEDATDVNDLTKRLDELAEQYK